MASIFAYTDEHGVGYYKHHNDDGTIDIDKIREYFPVIAESYRHMLKHISEANIPLYEIMPHEGD